MADDNKGTDSAASDISIEMATEVLKKAGLHVLPQAAFARIREEAAAKAASEAAQAKAELERVQSEYAKASERLKSIDNQGKSADEIWRERQAEWTRQLEAQRAEADKARKEAADKQASVRSLFRDRALTELIAPDATSPEAAQAAHLLALRQFPTLSTDDTGALTYVDPAGLEHKGDAALSTVKQWWAGQKWAHRAPAPGPATHGGSAAPPPKDGPVIPPGTSPMDRQRILLEYEDRQRTGRK